jgi:hypothetical protein
LPGAGGLGGIGVLLEGRDFAVAQTPDVGESASLDFSRLNRLVQPSGRMEGQPDIIGLGKNSRQTIQNRGKRYA